MPVFEESVVSAVLQHMNGDHPADNLLIAQAFGHTDTTASVMTTLDENGGTWLYTLEGSEIPLTLLWTDPIGERAEIRREIVVLYDAACERLGITPRPH